jgi:hypothetical protein
MYDHAEAARRRILARAATGGSLGERYVELANMLMREPNTPLRTSALKKLADSCDSAVSMVEKARQYGGNSRERRHPPGQRNG